MNLILVVKFIYVKEHGCKTRVLGFHNYHNVEIEAINASLFRKFELYTK